MDFKLFDKIAQNTNPEDGIVARFYDRSVKTEEVTKDGFPFFQNICFVEIRIKDNTSEIYDQPATPDKIKRFPVAYARYQLMKKQVKEGTPLEQFAFLTAGEVESLKIRGIFTVEALAGLEEEKAAIASDIRDIFAEAKSAGFDVKIMRTVIKLRKMNAADRDEQEFLLETYRKALDI